MKRAHQLAASQEVVFVDSTSSCDSENHSITFMLTSCATGAAPLGIIITKGQTQDICTQGFQLLKDNISESFYKKNYPALFMTDYSKAEINALNTVWPQSDNLLCIFHVCQSFWRWLWDAKHNIPKEYQHILMRQFQKNSLFY
ncbi:hypothetical protein X975_03565, partial [Stegodyphus mimosarum]